MELFGGTIGRETITDGAGPFGATIGRETITDGAELFLSLIHI